MIKANILLEAASLNPTAIIDLFQLDVRPIGGPSVFYFHPGNKIDGTDIVFAGIPYAQWPMEAKGFEWSTSGTQSRPTISFGNVTGAFSSLNLQYDGLVKADVYRLRTFARYLDGMPEADAQAHFPFERWLINKVQSEDRETCTYELANPMDMEDLMLPRRLVMADTCQWVYRGDGCGYTGTSCHNQNDDPLPYQPGTYRGFWSAGVFYNRGDIVKLYTAPPQFFVCVYPHSDQTPPSFGNSNYWQRDECGLRLNSCQTRFDPSHAGAWLPFGGFPGTRMQPISTPGPSGG